MRRSSNPDMPFPGAAPPTDATAKRGLVVGAFAECYLFGAVVANLFAWELKPVWDYANLTAHGDYWQVNAFLDGGWTARARGYLTLLGATYLTASLQTVSSVKIPQSLTFTGYTTLGGATTGANPFKIWEGPCFIKDFAAMAPMALFEQEINVIGSGNPTTIA